MTYIFNNRRNWENWYVAEMISWPLENRFSSRQQRSGESIWWAWISADFRDWRGRGVPRSSRGLQAHLLGEDLGGRQDRFVVQYQGGRILGPPWAEFLKVSSDMHHQTLRETSIDIPQVFFLCAPLSSLLRTRIFSPWTVHHHVIDQRKYYRIICLQNRCFPKYL